MGEGLLCQGKPFLPLRDYQKGNLFDRRWIGKWVGSQVHISTPMSLASISPSSITLSWSCSAWNAAHTLSVSGPSITSSRISLAISGGFFVVRIMTV